MTVADTPGRPLRADAERNRRRILAAAAEVFADRGLDVSLDDIAAAAGVGVGTVYRRFPNKDSLIDALFEEKMGRVIALAREALEIEDPWEGLVAFMTGVCRWQAEDRGFKEALASTDPGRERVHAARDRIAPLAGELLDRAKAAGAVREDLGAFDVPLMHFAVGFVAEKTRDVSPDYWQRILTIFLDGIAARRDEPTAMPVAALDPDQFATAVSRRPRRC